MVWDSSSVSFEGLLFEGSLPEAGDGIEIASVIAEKMSGAR